MATSVRPLAPPNISPRLPRSNSLSRPRSSYSVFPPRPGSSTSRTKSAYRKTKTRVRSDTRHIQLRKVAHTTVWQVVQPVSSAVIVTGLYHQALKDITYDKAGTPDQKVQQEEPSECEPTFRSSSRLEIPGSGRSKHVMSIAGKV